HRHRCGIFVGGVPHADMFVGCFNRNKYPEGMLASVSLASRTSGLSTSTSLNIAIIAIFL
ncbi:hypothetical protein Q4488_18730, partial [Amphritea sp. 1_MG-2023]|uniref:hypothetical protein n=1 Tax=Amphritea sp. 1_MG-2023 TaxID=3062670 RepID=UPI0026E1939F